MKLNNLDLKKINHIKYLGLVINNELNRNEHVDHIKDEIILLIGTLQRCKF